MDSSSYLTIEKEAKGKYVVKKSTFLSFIFPLQTEKEVDERVKMMKKEFYDARHVCYAYVLGEEGEIQRSSDNGEPSGTAGRPILGVIRSRDLTNVMIAVVRYFGGIKLGVPGLIAAYKEAAELAVQAATVLKRSIEESFSMDFDYVQMNDVMKLLKREGAKILNNQVDIRCHLDVRIGKDKAEALINQLKKVGVKITAAR